MKLTRRQETFIRELLDFYHETRRPIHYTELAERLGVSRFTAYDMLRLLEEKGLVRSDYHLAADKAGPGRSEIVFFPTEEARRLLTRLGGEVEEHDWESWRDRLLGQFRQDEPGTMELAQEIFARVPGDEPDPLRYCVEVITIIFLRLKAGAGRALLLEFAPTLLPSLDEAAGLQGMALLGGFALGILVRENIDDYGWCEELMEHVKRCGDLIAEMSPAEQRHLAEVVRDLYRSFPAQE